MPFDDSVFTRGFDLGKIEPAVVSVIDPASHQIATQYLGPDKPLGCCFDYKPEDLPEEVLRSPVDSDGYFIPYLWQSSPNWMKQPIQIRANWSKQWIIGEVNKKLRAKMEKPTGTRAGATNFTTQYAINWGRRQTKKSGLNWVLIDREKFVKSTRPGQRDRHEDLQLGLDVLFDDGEPGMVGIQAAGKGERAIHWERFVARGGVETATRRFIRVFYLEFIREDIEPIRHPERWA